MKGGSLIRATRKPLMKPTSAADGEAAEDRDRRRDAVAEGELAHDDRAQHHDRADREVDAGGQDHQRLRRADDADDRHLLQDQRQREGREELRPSERRRRSRPTAPARSAAPAPGCECSTCWMRSSSGLSWRSKEATSVALPVSTFSNSWDRLGLGVGHGVLPLAGGPVPGRSGAGRPRGPPLVGVRMQAASAPALLQALGGVDRTRRPRPACR